MKKIRDFKTIRERREFLEKTLGINLSKVGQVLVDKEKVHCENLTGAISVPLGVAGPLKIKGKYVDDDFYIPLATTEGALVASVQRGTKAVSRGIRSYADRVGITRGPVFYTKSLLKAKEFEKWITDNQKMLTKHAEKTSKHLKLMKTEVETVGIYTWIRFCFDTDRAMGMNMATIAAEKLVKLIEKKINVKCISVAGNYDIDKKPAWLNFIKPRGIKAWAEAVVSKKVVKEILKTTPEKLFDIWLSKCMLGSAISGSLGFNAHYANVIASIFTATGQDIAHVVEGSLGVTVTEVLPDRSLYISVYLPSLCIGTVGGGTVLKTQNQARSIIGVKNPLEFAEVIAGAVLAGELSLLASLAEGSLGKVHKKLGR